MIKEATDGVRSKIHNLKSTGVQYGFWDDLIERAVTRLGAEQEMEREVTISINPEPEPFDF